ncbi:MAG TPA: hypothetical protein VM658_20385 [bacterium]|nr:hypothetical protein [bacterium]
MAGRTGIMAPAAVALAIVMMAGGAGAATVDTGAGKLSLSPAIKFIYTYRDRHEESGVAALSSAGLRMVELDAAGGMEAKVGWLVELVAANGIYRDPITGMGAAAPSGGPNEFGTIGVRRAEIELRVVPRTVIVAGTFIPAWSPLQERATTDWGLVDLPLILTRPEWRALGWQNTGIALAVNPLDQLELGLFYVNGYMPGGLAGNEAPLPLGGTDREKGMGGRVKVMLGPVRIFGALYGEGWQEDLRGSPRIERYHLEAWVAGAELVTPKVQALFEWTDLMIPDYQLKLTGKWANLRSLGGHVDLSWWMLDDWQALFRWEWIDPNTADDKHTFVRSRFDQLVQYTVGVNYRVTEGATVMVNFVVPIEEGHKVDMDSGKVGGKYQAVENNYFRVQVQVRQ